MSRYAREKEDYTSENCVNLQCDVFFLIVGSCSNKRVKGPRVYMNGVEQSIGAEIYVDGVKIGEMVGQEYTGPASGSLEKGDKFAFGRPINISEKDIQNKPQKFDYIHVPMGKHVFKFISEDGNVLEKEFEIKGETYMGIDFKDMTIG